MARTFVIWVNQLLGVPGPSPWPAIALTVALFLVSSHILALLPGRRRTPLRPRSRPRARSRPPGTHTRPQGDPRHPTHTAASAPPGSLADRILRQASAYARVTVNLAGTILHEIDPSLLSASATPVPEAADLLTWLCAATDVYVVVRVVDDQGEENVRASLQKLGVLSEKVLPPHRVLCCETEVGLKSIVRQIEPELHVDAHHHVAVELGRFLPNVLYITSPHHPSASTTPTSSAAPTVPSTLLSATSFRAFFGP